MVDVEGVGKGVGIMQWGDDGKPDCIPFGRMCGGRAVEG